jgi:hypothetical protein
MGVMVVHGAQVGAVGTVAALAVASTVVNVSPYSTNGALALANAKEVDQDAPADSDRSGGGGLLPGGVGLLHRPLRSATQKHVPCSDSVRVSDGTRTRDRLDHNQRPRVLSSSPNTAS